MKKQIEDLNISGFISLISPGQLKKQLPATDAHIETVAAARKAIQNILTGKDPRLLAIIGPCSIHDSKAALDYARRLKPLVKEFEDSMYIIMRVYFEKPRTTIGWRGFINDPHLDDSCHMSFGLRQARKLLLQINGMGVPAATELLDPVVPQYLADLISWTAIGARTTESQTHRQMASGLSMPVGFKNGTDGNIQVAMDAMQSAKSQHSFLGVDSDGLTCVVKTKGNPSGHMVMRGGRDRTNYDEKSVREASRKLKSAGLWNRVVVDCSHGNTGKKHELQEVVWDNVIDQFASGGEGLMGAMVESHLFPGNQPIPKDLSKLKYGVSITDECIGWDKTEEMLRRAHETLKKKFSVYSH